MLSEIKALHHFELDIEIKVKVLIKRNFNPLVLCNGEASKKIVCITLTEDKLMIVREQKVIE